MSDLKQQLDGYRMTTVEILYHMPDHPSVLQSFVWQNLDMAPSFPVLRKFLDFWRENLDGPLHSVRVAHVAAVQAAEFRHHSGEYTIH